LLRGLGGNKKGERDTPPFIIKGGGGIVKGAVIVSLNLSGVLRAITPG
jgi:hypothetical protein